MWFLTRDKPVLCGQFSNIGGHFCFHILGKKCFWHIRVKASNLVKHLPEDLSLLPALTSDSLQTPVTPAPGALIFSSGLYGYMHTCTYIYTDIHACMLKRS